MANRVIYVEPGEIVEVRIVRADLGFEKNARGWREQSRPDQVLCKFDFGRISAALNSVKLDHDWLR